MQDLILLGVAVAAAGIGGYLYSRRYSEEAVYRRRLRKERAKYDSVMASRREAEEASRLP